MTARQVPGQLPLWEGPAPVPRRTRQRLHWGAMPDQARPATRPGNTRLHGRRIHTIRPQARYL